MLFRPAGGAGGRGMLQSFYKVLCSNTARFRSLSDNFIGTPVLCLLCLKKNEKIFIPPLSSSSPGIWHNGGLGNDGGKG